MFLKPYEDFIIYGPYTNREGRKFIVAYKDRKRHTISYPKFLAEVALGRKLDPKQETIDHIDGDFNNNSWDNMRIIDLPSHAQADVYKLEYVEDTCIWCGLPIIVNPKVATYNNRLGHAGPFCSRTCSGQYGAALQNGQIEKLPPQKAYSVEERVYTKPQKVGGILLSDVVPVDMTEEYILTQIEKQSNEHIVVEKEKKIKKAKKRVVREPLHDKKCAFCGELFSPAEKSQKYCCKECYHASTKGQPKPESQRKVKNRPSKKRLEKLVWQHPTVHIAAMFGVSDKAIAKWCKFYGIEKPPRGYWAKKQAGKT